jgi:hypothetical protein
LFADPPESIGNGWELGEHGGEPLNQRQQSRLRHNRAEIELPAALRFASESGVSEL